MKSVSQIFLFISLLLLLCKSTNAQSSYDISFDSTIITVTRSKTTDIIYPITLKTKLGDYKDSSNYKLVISAAEESTFPTSDYKLDFNVKPFSLIYQLDNEKYTYYLTIKKDTNPSEDRDREIVLNLDVFKDSKSLNLRKKLLIKIKPKPSDSLIGYNYLAYIGTNFDLVDGQKAKNVFFANNVFLQPAKKSVGLYLSLYGNRTMTATDTNGNIRRVTQVIGISDSTYKSFTEQSTLLRTYVSDNLGAYVSPLVRLGRSSNVENTLQLYYTPSLEFVWRRTNIKSEYSNSSNIDSSIVVGSLKGRIDFPNTVSSNVNEYVFNFGLIGLMVVHQSKTISVRVHGAVGYSSTYSPLNSFATSGSLYNNLKYDNQSDIFFCGRAWITESVTGLTLQAEITNAFKYSRPYYGVTLSKAINFQSLGKIFQPISTR